MKTYLYLFIFTKIDNEEEEENNQMYGLPIVHQEYKIAELLSHDVVPYINDFRRKNQKYVCTSVSILCEN